MRKPVSTWVLVAGMALASVGYAKATFADTVTLNVASWAGPNHAISAVGLKTWAEEIERKSQGTLQLEISFPPVHPKVMYDRVREGVSDISWGFNGYTPGRFTTYRIVELPGLGAGSEAASVAYWRTHEKHLSKANEYPGVKLLSLFAQPPSVIHSRDKLSSVQDMEDKKIRVGGGIQGEIASHLGMVGVQAPVPEAYNMLKEGVVDGTFFPAETALSFKLTEVTNHQLGLRSGLFGGAYFVVMNPESFADLSAEHQAIIEETTGEMLARRIGKAWDAAEDAAIEKLQKAGTFRFANEDLENKMMDSLKPLQAQFIEDAEDIDVDGRAALTFLRAQASKVAGQE